MVARTLASAASRIVSTLFPALDQRAPRPFGWSLRPTSRFHAGLGPRNSHFLADEQAAVCGGRNFATRSFAKCSRFWTTSKSRRNCDHLSREKAFGGKMDTLMRMQASYDIARTRKHERKSTRPSSHSLVAPGHSTADFYFSPTNSLPSSTSTPLTATLFRPKRPTRM